MEMSAQFHGLSALLPKKNPPENYSIGGWMVPIAGLDVVEKNIVPQVEI
jgi:hypothetical protein